MTKKNAKFFPIKVELEFKIEKKSFNSLIIAK
jgi:hypothetical protein